MTTRSSRTMRTGRQWEHQRRILAPPKSAPLVYPAKEAPDLKHERSLSRQRESTSYTYITSRWWSMMMVSGQGSGRGNFFLYSDPKPSISFPASAFKLSISTSSLRLQMYTRIHTHESALLNNIMAKSWNQKLQSATVIHTPYQTVLIGVLTNPTY